MKIIINSLSNLSQTLLYDIEKLRYDIYCTELKQYSENSSGRLIETISTTEYIIVCDSDTEELMGFVCVTPPFSEKNSVSKYLSQSVIDVFASNFFEIRCLSIKDEYRHSYSIVNILLGNLMLYCTKYCPCNMVTMARKELFGTYMKSVKFNCIGNPVKCGETELIPLQLYVQKNELLSYAVRIYPDIQLDRCLCPHGLGVTQNTEYCLDVLDNQYNLFENSLYKHSPDAYSRELRQKIASVYSVDTENVSVGCGLSQLIFAGLQSVFTKYDTVSVLYPTYEEYEFVLRNIVNCKIHRIYITDETTEETIANECKNSGSVGLVLVSPNSPLPFVVDIEKLSAELPQKMILWVDETYFPFYNYLTNNDPSFSYKTPKLISNRNCIIARSMSKIYSMSGLRLGYCISTKSIITLIDTFIPPWSVNVIANQKGIEIHTDLSLYNSKIKETLNKTIESRDILINTLKSMIGLKIINSEISVNYIFVHTETDFYTILSQQNIKIRRYKELQNFYRITVPSLDTVQAIVTRLDKQ